MVVRLGGNPFREVGVSEGTLLGIPRRVMVTQVVGTFSLQIPCIQR